MAIASLFASKSYQQECAGIGVAVTASFNVPNNKLTGTVTAVDGTGVDCTFTSATGVKTNVPSTPEPVFQWKPECQTGSIMLQTFDGAGWKEPHLTPPLTGWFKTPDMKTLSGPYLAAGPFMLDPMFTWISEMCDAE